MDIVDRAYRYVSRYPKPYVELLDRIHQHVVPRTYVEIGVAAGVTIRLALPGTVVLGVDPRPRLSEDAARAIRLFRMTSDEFFDTVDVKKELGGLAVDLAFIDGMHQFEYALRDFINLERFSSPATTILVHDCLPIDEASAGREHTTFTWSGDVWKLVLCLKQWRPGLVVHVVDVAPTGLAIISGCDPASTVLSDNYEEILEQYVGLSMDCLGREKAEKLSCITDEWNTVAKLLPGDPFRRMNVESLKARRVLTRGGSGLLRRSRRVLARARS